ncbi:lipopolysaccharide biosynthesis protein [Polaribacter sp. MED152]|uniref:lipopolysaccharide biosynthesis protein n=1 Tax=Polaribacter sp. MED152 TaxID=313598 RepID=UPI000068C52F|nr:hypothetical protein [Polaribacter sp. MED152]EAQ42177.1 hypothetical protein MED152_05645 [Polaribacter sp. MED152]
MKNKMKYRLHKKLLQSYNKDKIRYFYDFVIFGLGFFISSFIGLIISILVNKGLPKEELGLFNYNKSVLEFLTYVFTLVMYRSYIRFNITGLNVSLKSKVKKINYLAFILISLVAYYLTESIFSLFFAFFVFFEERLYLFRSLMLVKKVNFLKITVSLITLILISILVFTDHLNPNYIFFCYGIGFFLSLFFKNSNYKKLDTEEIRWKTILLYTLPVLGSMLVKLSLDIVSQYLIKDNFNPLELSKYAIATRVLLSVKVFSSLFMMFFPVIYFREIKKKNGKFINKLRFLISFSMLIIIAFAIYYRELIYTLMGASKYIEFTNLFSILVVSEFMFVLGGLYGVYLSYALKTQYALLIYTSGALLNLIVLHYFLNTQGINMAAYSILISNILMTALFVIFSYRLEFKYINSTS